MASGKFFADFFNNSLCHYEAEFTDSTRAMRQCIAVLQGRYLTVQMRTATNYMVIRNLNLHYIGIVMIKSFYAMMTAMTFLVLG